MKKFWGLLQAGLKVILAGALAVGAWFALTPYFRVDRNTEGDFFKNLPENTLDVLCLGSSHMQFAFNPAIFYAKTGLYSYVMGSACQQMTLKQREPVSAHESSVLCDRTSASRDGMVFDINLILFGVFEQFVYQASF